MSVLGVDHSTKCTGWEKKYDLERSPVYPVRYQQSSTDLPDTQVDNLEVLYFQVY